MISHTKIQEIKNSIESIGEIKTRKQLRLSKETFNRYKRLIRQGSAKTTAKTLLVDIETLYMVAGVWRPWKQNINTDQVFKRTCLLSWSAKWLNDNEVLGDILTPKEAKTRDDERITKSLWKLMDNADVIIAHNGQAYDLPRIKAFFAIHELPPLSPYQLIDTYKEAKKQFGFDYNKLSWLAQVLDVPYKKIKTDFDLWIGCDNGDPASLKAMLEYNKMDVLVMEEIYYRLRPFIHSHPNMNLYTDKNVCANCGSENITEKGTYKTSLNSYKTMVCGDCGAYSRVAKHKLASVAR